MLTLTFVESFIAVVDHGGVREAARAKGLSQAAVSQHLRKLESEMGVALLHRSHAACIPTPDGHCFLPLARGLVALAQRARDLFHNRHLRLAASSNIGVYFLPRLLGAFRALLGEDIEVDVSIGPNPDLIAKFKDGLFDIALTEWWEGNARFQDNIWHREPLVAILPPGHPLAGHETLTLEMLSAYPLIVGESGSGTAQLMRSLPDCAPLPKPALTLGSTEAVKQSVMAGLGVSIVLAGSVARAPADELAVRPLAHAGLRKPFHVVVPANLPDSAPSARLVNFLCSQGAAHA